MAFQLLAEAFDALLEILHFSSSLLFLSRLTLPRTASRPPAAFQIEQSRKRAALRWRD
jgi:hypothetical protein